MFLLPDKDMVQSVGSRKMAADQQAKAGRTLQPNCRKKDKFSDSARSDYPLRCKALPATCVCKYSDLTIKISY